VSSQAWQYHDLTKHSYWSVRSNPHYLDWHNLPNPFKEYLDLPRISLPEKAAPGGMPALQAIAANGSTRATATKPGQTVLGINIDSSIQPDLFGGGNEAKALSRIILPGGRLRGRALPR
jgi:hypothetical protein